MPWPPRWALALALTGEEGMEGWSSRQREEALHLHAFAQAVPTGRSPFFPLPYFKTLSVLKAQSQCLPSG